MDRKEITEVIEWCDEKGYSDHEILELPGRIADAKPGKKKVLHPEYEIVCDAACYIPDF